MRVDTVHGCAASSATRWYITTAIGTRSDQTASTLRHQRHGLVAQ